MSFLEFVREKRKDHVGEIPINDDRATIIKEIRKEQGLTMGYVFTYGKRNISRVESAFKGALNRAGIENFRFHDLRYTFASYVLMRGGTLKDVKEIFGHQL